MTPVAVRFYLAAEGVLHFPRDGDPTNLLTMMSEKFKDASKDWDEYEVEAKCVYCGCAVDVDELDGWECPCQDIAGPSEDDAHEERRQEEVDAKWLTPK